MPAIAQSRTPNYQRIRRLSQVLEWACLGLIAVLPVAVATYWTVPDAPSFSDMTGTLAMWQRLTVVLISELSLALLLTGIWQARKCFKKFAAGAVFSSESVLSLKRFAGWAGAFVVASVLSDAAISVVLSFNHPMGQRQISIGVGLDHLCMLFFVCMVWLMAAVIAQGQILAEDNATII